MSVDMRTRLPNHKRVLMSGYISDLGFIIRPVVIFRCCAYCIICISCLFFSVAFSHIISIPCFWPCSEV